MSWRYTHFKASEQATPPPAPDTAAAVAARARRGSLQENLRASSLHRSVHPATSALFVLSCLANGTPPFCSPAAGPLASVR